MVMGKGKARDDSQGQRQNRPPSNASSQREPSICPIGSARDKRCDSRESNPSNPSTESTASIISYIAIDESPDIRSLYESAKNSKTYVMTVSD
jgi:hypothetical protein